MSRILCWQPLLWYITAAGNLTEVIKTAYLCRQHQLHTFLCALRYCAVHASFAGRLRWWNMDFAFRLRKRYVCMGGSKHELLKSMLRAASGRHSLQQASLHPSPSHRTG